MLSARKGRPSISDFIVMLYTMYQGDIRGALTSNFITKDYNSPEETIVYFGKPYLVKAYKAYNIEHKFDDNKETYQWTYDEYLKIDDDYKQSPKTLNALKPNARDLHLF